MKWEKLEAQVRQKGCATEREARFSKLTTFKIGGETALLIDVPLTAAAEVAALCREAEVPTLWIGRGSNLLVGDRRQEYAVLRLCDAVQDIRVEGTRLTAPAGTSLTAVCRAARDHGLGGLEFAFGIPGTVGGGVYMNAGAYGGEMKDVLETVTVLTRDGRVEKRSAASLELGYRHSALMDGGEIVLEATFALAEADCVQIGARMEELIARRRDKQPLEYPSAGSFFKRPEGHFAGALIEQCGLKGFRVGDAQVSEKHAGFVVNRGNATCEQMRDLAARVRERVAEETGVTLEPEVRLIGEKWPWEA